MQKEPKKAFTLEFRNYSLPLDFPVVALLRDKFSFPQIAVDANHMHFHNCVEFGLCWKGEGVLAVEDQLHPYSTGDFTILPPYATHITYRVAGRTDAQSEYLYCDPKLLLEGLSPGFINCLSRFNNNTPDFPYVIHARDMPVAHTLFLEILAELRDCKPNYQEAVRGLFAAFIVSLLRVLPPPQEKAQPTVLSRRIFSLSGAVQYVQTHYAQQIPIEVLADVCFMSLTNFRRLFKTAMGCSPLQYITQVRIQKAQELLYTTELSVLDISLKTGFETLSTFNRHFLDIVGMPPMQWRKLCRNIPKKGYSYTDFVEEQRALKH